MFFKFNKNKTQENQEKKILKKSSFFSNDFFAEKHNINLQTQINKVFKKTIKDFVAIKNDGSIIKGYAMDGMEEQLAQAKIDNSNVGMPEGQALWYSNWGFIGYQMCAIIAQHWLVDKACSQIGRDAIRHGYQITSNDGNKINPEILNDIAKYDKLFQIKKQCLEFAHQGKVFGIRHALFLVESDDPEYYKKPFNIDAVKPNSYKGISQIDPYWLAPAFNNEDITNPIGKNFYEPTYWIANGRKIHKSHFVIYKTNIVADILKPSYLFGGIPLPQQIAERIYCAERTANEVPLLVFSKRLVAVNLDEIGRGMNQEEFEAKMTYFTEIRNNFGIYTLGQDEKIQQFETSLAALNEAITTQYNIVAAIAKMPATKLLGTSPKGFNSTGEFEENNYNEELQTCQENDLTPLIEKHHQLLMQSIIKPKYNAKDFDITIKWNPTKVLNELQNTELNMKKAQTDSILISTGAINGIEARNRIIQDKNSNYNGLEQINDEMIEHQHEDDE